MDTNKLITFIKFSFLLFVFTLSTYASSQEVEVVVRVKEVIEDDESEDEVFERALKRSKDEALIKAGVIERHQSYFYTSISEKNGDINEQMHYKIYSELDGNILSSEVLKKERKKIDKIWHLILKVKIVIIKYQTIKDPTFVADFDGIKKVYQDSSCIKFKIDPNQDCFLTIFYLTDEETQILYPTTSEETRDTRLHNRLFKKGEIVPINWICTALKGKHIEHGSLICVMTKEYIPFYEREKNHQFSTQTSRDDFLKWISVIERNKKNLKEFSITIVPKE